MSTQHIARLQSKAEPTGLSSLIEIGGMSYAEFRMQTRGVLSGHEARILHRAALHEKQENLLYKSRLFTRANPLLKNAMRLGITPPHAGLHSYESMFGDRASQYVAPGSVASMFSPAAYLTELYREARALRAGSSLYHIDVRRPDLQHLPLSQQNLDEELSVLSLSNELLMEGIKQDAAFSEDLQVLERLSAWRPTGATPYHDGFERVRQAVLAQGGVSAVADAAPSVSGLMAEASLLGMNSGYSPELYAILSEVISEQTMDALYTRNFGTIEPQSLMDIQALSQYYSVDYETLEYFIAAIEANASVDSYTEIPQKRFLLEMNKWVRLHQATTLAPVALDRAVDIYYPVNQVNTYITGEQTSPAITPLSDGGWVVAWQCWDPGRYGTFLQRYTVYGEMIGRETRIDTGIGGTYPSGVNLATLLDGGWVATWHTSGPDGSSYGIFQQRYTASGSAIGPTTQVNTQTANWQVYPGVCGLPDGGWVINWRNDAQGGNTNRISQQRFDSSGARVGGENNISTTNSYPNHKLQSVRTLVTLKDGGWVATWEVDIQDGSNKNIYFRRYDSTGNAAGEKVRANSTIVGVQSSSSLIALDDGGWIVLWTSDNDSSGSGVYMQRYNADNTLQGIETRINTTTYSTQDLATGYGLQDGGWVVVWASDAQDGSGYGVYQQRFLSDGTRSGGEVLVNHTTYSDQSMPNVVSLKDGGWVVTFRSNLQDGSSGGIYQQRYNANGEISSDAGEINDPALRRVADMLFYMQRYGIDHEKALILCNAPISETVYDNEPSQFDRLFNTPPLNGYHFTPDGTELNLTPGSADDPRKAVLKRALHADDVSLYRLLLIADPTATDGRMINTIVHQSNLYLASLLAEVHTLSVDELALLLAALGESATNLSLISAAELRRLTDRLHRTVTWLQAHKWSVSDLFVMTTTGYSTTLTPDIQNFLDSLNGGLNGTSASGDALITLMAPYAAASLRLTSSEVAQSLLHWIDKLQPTGIDVDKFWGLIKGNAVPTSVAIQFCHALAQLAVIYNAVSLDARSLALLVTTPLRLVSETVTVDGVTVAGHDADTLRQLMDYTDWLGSLKAEADSILSLLCVPPPATVVLPPAEVAKAMGRDEQLLMDAAAQALTHGQIAAATTLASWPEIAVTLQWVALADLLGISPERVNAWLALDYLDKEDPAAVLPVPIPYGDWNEVASTLTAGLDDAQALPLENRLAESLSAALVGYYLYEVADVSLNLKSRDDLYQYLLIDNQVSAEIMTTRIAEAIASVQLYVKRALDQVEPEVDITVVSRQFFVDWTTYNQRYSTWVGVSQLAYYPENYIDPTQRIGQTGMMDTLLQTISQSSLTSDSVEDAFNNYLASFEQVANLDVISGYHANVNIHQGLTYIIGASRSEEQAYYWRSLNHAHIQDGKSTGNAWTDWLKIECAINPWQGIVRPVTRNSRLHVIWMERDEQATNTAGVVKNIYTYTLKLSHLRYDGSWSAPLSYPVDDYLAELNLAKEEAPGLYCAENSADETFQVILYQRRDELSDTPASGFRIEPDFDAVKYSNIDVAFIQNQCYPQWDTADTVRINQLFVDASKPSTPSSVLSSSHFDFGNYGQEYGDPLWKLSLVKGSAINKIEVGGLNNRRMTIAPTLLAKYSSSNDLNINLTLESQINLMKLNHTAGDWLQMPQIFGNLTGVNSIVVKCNPGLNRPLITCTTTSRNPYDTVKFECNGPAEFDRTYFIMYAAEYAYNPSFADVTGILANGYIIDYITYANTEETHLYPCMIRDGEILKTAIPVDKIRVIVKAGGADQVFTVTTDFPPAQSFDSMSFPLNPIEFSIAELDLVDDYGEVEVILEAYFESDHLVGREYFTIPVQITATVTPEVLTLVKTDSDAQYIQSGPYRVRTNTLFARQLVDKAARGLDAILSLETQQLPEPALGTGGYAKVTLPKYDRNVHGNNAEVKLELFSGDRLTPGATYFPFISATLRESAQELTLFVPASRVANNDPVNFPESLVTGLGVALYCQAGRFYTGQLTFDGNTLDLTGYTPTTVTPPAGRDPTLQVLPDYVEPMDFNGANALYFWELFYYTPMLVAQRLLQEQSFDEAQRWLEYVWNPAGYVVNGKQQNVQWNVRPLLEDTSWNSEPLDSTDPDAVAQYDPMHYKVSTFMRTLDLLLARGDAAYRRLERDTLNEAKMWYMQALHLLGEQPYVPSGDDDWGDPTLDAAADLTLQSQSEQTLMALRQGQEQQPSTLTANSLTGLFLPQANEMMLSYWQTLAQRLFNLRHNLSIDGQPLSLPVYATPADPAALHSAAVNSSQGGSSLPGAYLPQWRFPQMLENARAMVNQLSQFGATLLSLRERQDAEALAALLQGQAKELMLLSLDMQTRTLAELDTEHASLTEARRGAKQRLDHFTHLYEENVNSGETAAMNLYMASSVVETASTGLHMAAAALEMVPNIYGLAVGGSRYGALLNAVAIGSQLASSAMQTSATKISQSELYRRRRQEWELQRNNADAEVAQLDAQLQGNVLRRESAVMQQHYLESQQQHTQAQLAFLQGKFSNQALYSWMNGRLSALYFQLYDLAVGRCLMAEQSYRHVTQNATASFIKPGAWQSSYAGLLSGETLQLNLAQMDDAYLRWDARALEVTRTLSLADIYAAMPGGFDLDAKIDALLNAGTGSAGTATCGIKVNSGKLQVFITLSELGIRSDYPSDMQLGDVRRIKQLSVSLPALVGPYQDIQATLAYGGSTSMPKGCNALAVSHGLNDSGQFQLDFNDGKFLPFEGIAIDDSGLLTLTFPNATGKQKSMLLSLSDVIMHINYTIRS